MIETLEKIRPQVIRGIKLFYGWKAELKRNSDYLCLKNPAGYGFLEGVIINSNGKKVSEAQFGEFLKQVVIPYSQAEGYVFSDSYEDYLVGALARINLNLNQLSPRTRADINQYLNFFPSNNIYDNNLAQAIEILQCIDEAIEILTHLRITDEKPIKKPYKAGIGIGVVEAPRGILYHMADVDNKGIIQNYEVIVPTAQNQINIENDLKKYFNENLNQKTQEELKVDAEKVIRAYDPCMSCATNFLEIEWIKK